jgi:hypothetical protein
LGVIKSRDAWVAHDGSVVCTDNRTFRIYRPRDRNECVFDFEITLNALAGNLTFGDTKEGTMALRLADTLRLKTKAGQGHFVLSTGARDEARHPTWWHVRDYGLFAANPFGQHDFEHRWNKRIGDFTIPAGKSVAFRYRFYLHEGDEKQDRVAERYLEYAK